MPLDLNTAHVRNLLYRLVGLRSGSIGQFDELLKLVIEVGRRGEFDLLYEQGIQPWVASRSRTAAAGQFPHVTIIPIATIGTHLIIIERAEIYASSGIIRAFVGSTLGTTVAATVVNRDTRFSRDPAAGIDTVDVADGETAVAPPAVGTQVWHDGGIIGQPWTGLQLLRPGVNPTGQLDQLAFQGGIAATTLTYTIYGYVLQERR